MTLASRFAGDYLGLPAADTYDVVVDSDLPVQMPDGVILLADRFYPRAAERAPLILVRSPYGRTGLFGLLFGRLIAERGFQVVVQSCRGTFDSGGELNPFVNERTDGVATVRWLERQPWFPGAFGTLGPSYLGLAQWALARDAGPALKAMALQITASQFRDQSYPGESFALATALGWSDLMTFQESGLFARFTARRRLRRGVSHLPLNESDRASTGKAIAFYREWLEHNQPGEAFWAARDFSDSVPTLTAPAQILSGWFDIFLPWTLEDYRALRAAGRSPHLIIGPWTHADPAVFAAMLRESIAWMRAHLLGETQRLPSLPVRLFVMGANEWREYDEWPPRETNSQRWYLHGNRGLGPEQPDAAAPDTYRYDPADPTPMVGGVVLGPGGGSVDNRRLEARGDVLTYTSATLHEDVEVIGDVSVELWVSSSLEHTDFFARLCDVWPDGRSMNLCDGLIRVQPGRGAQQPDGLLRIEIALWPTAHRFKRGHRLRLQISSGAHPRFARNTGSGEPLATATTLRVAQQTIFHDAQRQSAVVLPIQKWTRE